MPYLNFYVGYTGQQKLPESFHSKSVRKYYDPTQHYGRREQQQQQQQQQ